MQATILLSMLGMALSILQLPKLQILEPSSDYDVYDTNTRDVPLTHYHIQGVYNSTGRNYSAYVAVFDPIKFSMYPPTEKGCTRLVQTSVSSKRRDCEYATNGGFFTWDFSQESLCIGNLISDSTILQTPADGFGRANFGITKDNHMIIGFIDESILKTYNFTQLTTGCGWLVRNGESYVAKSKDLSFEEGGFTLEKAPRTTIGLFNNGSMILLEIDGEEDIKAGPDLFETAELLVSLGVYSAINIDGGGSSTSVYNGEVIDQPTCNDTPLICERPVASFACVRK